MICGNEMRRNGRFGGEVHDSVRQIFWAKKHREREILMRARPLRLAGSWVVETDPFVDPRGMFARLFCLKELGEICDGRIIRQINLSRTISAGTIRGMHFQRPPCAEAKFVRCNRGEILDVIVDLRQGSSTFRQWHAEHLTGENMRMMYVPEGFAHGFQTLSDDVEMIYLHTAAYCAESESGVRFDDPLIDIKWPMAVREISDRDRNHALLMETFEGLTL